MIHVLHGDDTFTLQGALHELQQAVGIPDLQDANTFREVRDFVSGKMTAAQIAEAQRLAQEWKPKTWE